jgi:serine/threonine-protein kinase/endoribonuclease IRE1
MAAASLLDAAVVDSSRLREKPDAGKGWVWWVCGVLGTLLLCGFAALGLSKHPGEKLATTPPTDEKTPLLAERKPKSESERVVTFVEPTLSPTTASAVTVAEGEDLATPGKKKSARRRVRGRKKKKDDSASVGGEGEGEEEEVEDDKGEGSSSGTPPKGKGEKPLPDLPREISGTDIHDQSDKERLAISDTIIGYGSHGTVVLKGTWGGRPVAVKRLLSDFTRLASQEVKLLQASDDHPNVIRCERFIRNLRSAR